MNSTKKIGRNLLWGFFAELIAIVVGILVPRWTLVSYGSEINGCINSITQIYTYIALLEAGVGTVTLQALYKPTAEKNKNQINGILSATNKYYCRTGIGYILAIVVLSVIYPLIVRSDIPFITIVLIIVFNGLGGAISYFCQAKYFIFLQSSGKNYVQTSLNLTVNVIKNVGKIVLMNLGFDVVWVQSLALIVSLLQMVYIMLYIRKCYPWINLKAAPDYETIKQSKNVWVHQISGLIFHSTDTILLSVFCGLKEASVYAIYAMLFNYVTSILGVFSNSTTFLVGQKYDTNKKQFNQLFDIYELAYIVLSFIVFTITSCFILPFISLYTRGIEDINYLDKWIAILFLIVNILSQIRIPLNQIIIIKGDFKQTQGRSIIEAVINLTVSIIAIQFLGIYGVLLGTIVALLFRTNDIIIYSNRRILNRRSWCSYKRILVNSGIFLLITGIKQLFNFDLNSYVNIVLVCIPYALAVSLCYIVVNGLFEIKTIKKAIQTLKNKKIIKKEILNEDIG